MEPLRLILPTFEPKYLVQDEARAVALLSRTAVQDIA